MMFCKAVMNWHFLGQKMKRVRNSTVKKDTQTRSIITRTGCTTVSLFGTTVLTACLSVRVVLGVEMNCGLWSEGMRVILMVAVALAAFPLPSEAWIVS